MGYRLCLLISPKRFRPELTRLFGSDFKLIGSADSRASYFSQATSILHGLSESVADLGLQGGHALL